ncbi:Glycosyl transferase family 2 [Sulfidibacter corallicola]|uniref:Glycosyltransferase 2-like domain-containing protein n=1 Tax=Sulfidibacter corallicola TaxID=2818388 RepID=A0A8A4TVV1_SULCO|nr:hypothetical protein [Sulfidibacter corallicola]QTD53298.1 hypothetical protein J3U87_12655 [Sulfidibacter corallicola]
MTAVHLCIPVYDEREWLPDTLAGLASQEWDRSEEPFEVWVCVNQGPQTPERIRDANRETLHWLERTRGHWPFRLHVLDATSPPAAPDAREAGVGWARRHLFRQVVARVGTDFIGVSLDADTHLEPNYLGEVVRAFARHPNAVGLAAPFYHRLPQDPQQQLNLLRYELYIRYYQINLWRIGSPYAFVALGSAMAFCGWAYAAARGFPVRAAGEDFYLLQALRKIGPLIRWIDSRVYPASRPSERVPFGTGILVAEEDLGLQRRRFPFFAPSSFELLGRTYAMLPDFFRVHRELPIGDFLERELKGYGAFDRMRGNFKDERRFVKAWHERVDGLRILQMLRFFEPQREPSAALDAERLGALFEGADDALRQDAFSERNLAELDVLRDRLCRWEARFQRRFMADWKADARW